MLERTAAYDEIVFSTFDFAMRILSPKFASDYVVYAASGAEKMWIFSKLFTQWLVQVIRLQPIAVVLAEHFILGCEAYS